MDDLTAERFDPTWWGRRLAEHLNTSEGELAVFDDCAAEVARRRRSLAQAVHRFYDSRRSTDVDKESAGQERAAS